MVVLNDVFQGMAFVSEKKIGECRQLILIDADENHFQRFYNGREWGDIRPYEFDKRAKLRRLYDDLTDWLN